jgi:hypothetical protein
MPLGYRSDLLQQPWGHKGFASTDMERCNTLDVFWVLGGSEEIMDSENITVSRGTVSTTMGTHRIALIG